jgi:hypothetical protein
MAAGDDVLHSSGAQRAPQTDKQKVRKSFVESMFGTMMPRGTGKLKLSKIEHGRHGDGHDEEDYARKECGLPGGAHPEGP